eukprot:10984375-Karenia_brevis.AAC.1
MHHQSAEFAQPGDNTREGNQRIRQNSLASDLGGDVGLNIMGLDKNNMLRSGVVMASSVLEDDSDLQNSNSQELANIVVGD